MELGTIHKMVVTFQRAFYELNAQVSTREIEELAILIDKALTLDARTFHTPDHVFTLSDLPNPIQSLAGLFHDIVYYQVDEGFTTAIYTVISPYIEVCEENVFIVPTIDPNDRLVWLTLDVFGFEAGQKLSTFGGLNEYLSALVMAKKLAGIISPADLLKITVCIEATIPFRGRNEQGQDYCEMMECRLYSINQKYNFGFAPREIEDIVKLAVVFSNKDVESFSKNDPGKFLEDTWKLLPEANPSLRTQGLYSIKEYRQALNKTEAFMSSLNPDNIYKVYKGVPSPEEYETMKARAALNVRIGCNYLGIKLFTIAVLEALAEMTGGDAPIELFMGEVHQADEGTRRIEHFLPPVSSSPYADPKDPVFILLDTGRSGEYDFDLKNSPLASYLYLSLGPSLVRKSLEDSKAFFAGKLSARDFLERIDRKVLLTVTKTCAFMAFTRAEALNQLADIWEQTQ